MVRTWRRRQNQIGALALLATSLLVAAAQQPLSAAEKTRRIQVTAPATTSPPPAPAPGPAAAPDGAGYWVVGIDGGIYAYGAAPFKGSTGAMKLNKPMVGMAATPAGQGYWLVASDGGIFSFGDASFRGSTGAITLNKPIVGMAPTSSGKGYWLVASDGGIFAFGDAAFRGSTGAIKLNKPIVGMAPTRTGQGYWLVASDGGIFAFGDATFAGSTGNLKLVRPITGMAAAPTGRGYWMTASDGGVFSFGDARFLGAARDRIATPEQGRGVVAIVPTKSGAGYWQVAASGKVFAFGDAAALGAPTAARSAIVGMAANPGGTITVSAPMGAIRPLGLPSGPAPQFFGSASKSTWGTSPSEEEKDKAGKALAVAEAGNRVFIGGEFAGMVPPSPNQKGHQAAPVTPRPYLAALDAISGTPLNWDVHPDDAVLALAVSEDRRTLYVGGRFRQIAGAPVAHLAAIDIETGTLDAGFTTPAIDDPVKSIDRVRQHALRRRRVPRRRRRRAAPARRPRRHHRRTAGRLRPAGERRWVLPGPHRQRELFQQRQRRCRPRHRRHLRRPVRRGRRATSSTSAARAACSSSTPPPARRRRGSREMDRPVFGLAMWPGDSRTFFVATGGSGGTLQAFRIDDRAGPGPGRRLTATTTAPAGTAAGTPRVPRTAIPSRRCGPTAPTATPPTWWPPPSGCTSSATTTTSSGRTRSATAAAAAGARTVTCPNRHISVFEPHGGAHDIGFTGQLNTPQGPYAACVGARSLYVVGRLHRVQRPSHSPASCSSRRC